MSYKYSIKKLKQVHFHKSLLALIFYFSLSLNGQNSNNQWQFSANTALNFSVNPPSVSSGSIQSMKASASISDNTGSLLFYTDGINIYSSSHTVMANGSNLDGDGANPIQSCIIVKSPGSINLYYVFTTAVPNSTVLVPGLKYSLVDMSLAGGSGSVTIKNIMTHTFVSNAITYLRHCNGQDYWIIAHEYNSSNFIVYLLNSSGLQAVPSIQNIGPVTGYSSLKAASNQRKLALTTGTAASVVFDVDNSSGILSNPTTLSTFNSPVGAVYSEFSPDCSKIYFTRAGTLLSGFFIEQYDLCSGSNSSIQNSLYTFSCAASTAAMQLAPNGKIYVSKVLQNTLGVINNPNGSGVLCNFVDNGLSISPNTCYSQLPNFTPEFQFPALPSFSFNSNGLACQSAQFQSPFTPGATVGTCVVNQFTLQNLQWNFGDPLSGSANTSTLSNPTHTFTSVGSYSVNLILDFGCGYGIDTIKQVVSINNSCFSISSQSITCASLGTASITNIGSTTGPFSYTWMPSSQTGSFASNLNPGTHTVFVYDASINFTHTLSTTFIPLIPLSGNIANSSSISCFGTSTGTGAVTNIAGGSSLQHFSWFNGSTTFTNATTNSLSAGLWSVTVTDALTACTFSNVFFITQAPALNLSLSSNTPTNCAGENIILTGTNSGGTPFSSGPPYTYSWSAGPANDSFTVSQNVGGNYVYTLNSLDANNCLSSNTITVDFIANPSLSVSNVFICPLAIGTLSVSGATNYTWSSPSTTALSTGSNFTDAPLSTQQYTVVGEALGCSSQTMASIALYNSPNATLLDNGPRCNGELLSLSGFGGVSYVWSGPNSFTSTLQTNSINPVSLANAGVYNLTVTAATGCTASISKTVVVNPTPTLSAIGSTVCTSQTLNLSASSFTGSTYLWSGPPNFTSTLQNPFIVSPLVNNTGTYTVKVTSALGCTNIAIATASVAIPPSLTAQLSSNTLCSQAFNGSPNTITLTAGGANTYTLVTVPDMFNANPGGPISPLTAIPPNTGIASATLSGSNGVCTVTTGLTFSILPNPSITVSSPTPVICAGDTYTYTNNGASSYTWSSSTPGFTTYNNGGVAVSNPSINSVFSVFGGSLGCNSASKTSSITVNPLPVFSISPGTPTICLNNKITLSINGNASSYTWSPYVGLNSNLGATVSAFPTSLQTYTALGSLNSCTNTALITVSVLSLPSPTAIALKPELCLNELITLQGYGGESYRWDGPIGLMYAGQTVTFVASSRAFSGTYTLTVSDVNGCMASNQVGVKINPLPNADLSISKQNGCVPFSSKFSMYTQSANDSNIVAYWQLDNQTFYGKQFSYLFSSAKTYSIFGYYSDTLTTCKNSSIYLVEGYPLPKADFIFEPEKPVEGLDEVQFINTSSGDELSKFNWYFINNQGYKTENKNASYLFNELGEYPVAMVVQNKWGCADTMIKSIKVEADFNVYVPNAFTPNEDNLNDVFLPILRGVKLYELLIFDRWGKRIFLSTQIESGWDGYYNGEPAKNDVYTWKINLSTNSGEAKVYTGQVLLSR